MGAKKIDDHTMSLRDARARQILATARANLVGHVNRADRVAAALRTARDNIIKFDPKRFRPFASAHEQQFEREAAAARQQRINRTLSAARDTLARVAYIKRPSQKSEIVHRTIENARVAPTTTPRRHMEPPPPADGVDDLRQRFEVLHEAIPEVVAVLRSEFERDNDRLRRELDVTHRELDSLRRTVAGLGTRPS